MFKQAPQGIVYWPVSLPAANSAGELREATVHVGYRVLDRIAMKERQHHALARASAATSALAGAGKLTGGIEQALAAIESTRDDDQSDYEMLLDRIVGWRAGIDAETGSAIEMVEFSREALESALSLEWAFNALRRGLFEASRGAIAKNSKPGPGGAPAPAQA